MIIYMVRYEGGRKERLLFDPAYPYVAQRFMEQFLFLPSVLAIECYRQ